MSEATRAVATRAFRSTDKKISCEVAHDKSTGERLTIISRNNEEGTLYVKDAYGNEGTVPKNVVREMPNVPKHNQQPAWMQNAQREQQEQSTSTVLSSRGGEDQEEEDASSKGKRRNLFTFKKRKKDTQVGKDIGLPTAATHEGHLGFSSTGFEARNLPPQLQIILSQVDEVLKGMGMTGVTKTEAEYLLKNVMKNLPLDNEPTPVAASDSGEEATDSAAAHSQTEGDRQSQSFQFGGKLRVKSGDAGQRGFLATRGSASRVTRAVTPSSTEEDSDTNSETEEDQFHPPPTEKPPPPPQNAAPPPPQNKAEQLKEIREKYDEASERLRSQESEIEHLKREVERMVQQNKYLREEMKLQQDHASSEQEKRQTLESENSSLRNQLSEMSVRVGADENKEQMLEGITTNLKDQIAKLAESVSQETQRRKEVESKLVAIRQELEEANTVKSSLQSENQALTTKLADLKTKLTEERNRTEALEARLETVQADGESESFTDNSSSKPAQQDEDVSATGGRGAPPPPPSAPKPPPAGAPPPPSLHKLPTPSSTAAPSAGGGRGSLLEAIKSPQKKLKHVDKQATENERKKNLDDNSLAGILAKAIIDRRANMREEEGDAGADDLLWE